MKQKTVEFSIKLGVVFAIIGIAFLLTGIFAGAFACISIALLSFISAWLAHSFRHFGFNLAILLLYYFSFLIFYITQWPPFGLMGAGLTTAILVVKLMVFRYIQSK